jgi:hypothetical protein
VAWLSTNLIPNKMKRLQISKKAYIISTLIAIATIGVCIAIALLTT